MDLREFANRVDGAVDKMFSALPSDLARVRHELNGLRRLAASAREVIPEGDDSPNPGRVGSVAISDVRVRDVLLRTGTLDEFWKVLRVRRKRHQVDVVDLEGRQRIYNLCEFDMRWSEESAKALYLKWRY